MSRPRADTKFDPVRTASLDIEELEVIADMGDDNTYYGVNSDSTLPACLRCKGANVRTQDRFKKTYKDVIQVNGKNQFISLIHIFYKYRCLNQDCHHVFPKPITFAHTEANITYRLQNKLIHYAMYMSYSNATAYAGNHVSVQAVGQILKRWTAEKDEERGPLYSPKVLGLISCSSKKGKYVIAIDAGDDELHIIDVLPSVSSVAIVNLLNRMDVSAIDYILTDCTQTIVDTIKDRFPNVKILMDTDFLLTEIFNEFHQVLNKDGRQLYARDKRLYTKAPETLTEEETENFEDIRRGKNRERLNNAYTHMNLLRNLLSHDWSVQDIMNWNAQVPDDCLDVFEFSSAIVDTYWDELHKYYLNQEVVQKDIYGRLKALNEIVSKFSSYSDEVLRARILYLSPADYKNTKWIGLPLNSALKNMEALVNEGGL